MPSGLSALGQGKWGCLDLRHLALVFSPRPGHTFRLSINYYQTLPGDHIWETTTASSEFTGDQYATSYQRSGESDKAEWQGPDTQSPEALCPPNPVHKARPPSPRNAGPRSLPPSSPFPQGWSRSGRRQPLFGPTDLAAVELYRLSLLPRGSPNPQALLSRARHRPRGLARP